MTTRAARAGHQTPRKSSMPTFTVRKRKVEILGGSHNFRTARWSPDGKYIAALQPITHELMLCEVRKQRWSMLANSITGDNINWSSDSKSIYADSPRGEDRLIEQVRITDGKRLAMVSLAAWEKA